MSVHENTHKHTHTHLLDDELLPVGRPFNEQRLAVRPAPQAFEPRVRRRASAAATAITAAAAADAAAAFAAASMVHCELTCGHLSSSPGVYFN